jgi:hypothetical protein
LKEEQKKAQGKPPQQLLRGLAFKVWYYLPCCFNASITGQPGGWQSVAFIGNYGLHVNVEMN